MGKIVNSDWFYDAYQNHLSEKIKLATEISSVDEGLLKKFESLGFGRAEKVAEALERGLIESKHLPDEYDSIFGLEEEKLNAEQVYKSTIDELQGLREAKPFLIGGATLESLLNSTPRTYEYIANSKLPFNSMFFEFPSPAKMHAPFRNNEFDLIALWLGSWKSETGLNQPNESIYTAEVFLRDNDKKIQRLHLNFGSSLRGKYDGNLSPINDDDQDKINPVYFEIDTEKKEIQYSFGERGREVIRSKLTAELSKRTGKKFPKISSKNTHEYVKAYAQIENPEFLLQIPNLCTNIINYINAHNVTVIRKDRDVIEIERNERNKKKKVESKKPFYIITVQDKVYEEPDEPKETGLWQLEERIFVRGHDRRYRDDKGNIKMIGWVSPCIKGPPNAPFRDQRYQVLYDKLRRENELMAKYGVASYSSDLVMPKG